MKSGFSRGGHIGRIGFLLLVIASMLSFASSEPLEVKHGNFQTPSSTGQMSVDIGFEPDLIVFKITSTNTQFNTSETYTNNNDAEDFGWGHGYASCSTGSCDEVAQTDGSGSDSTNGYASASTDSYSIFQIKTDNSGDGFQGFINGTVTGTDASGFDLTFDAVTEQQQVFYTAYEFPAESEVDVGSFRTKSSEGIDSVNTGFKPNYLEVVTSPQINTMNEFKETGDGGTEFGWTFGWAAKRDDEPLEQVTLGTTLYSKDIDSHVASSNSSELIHTLWKQNSGPINGRLQAKLDKFTETGFDIDYTNVEPDTTEGNRFLVTYAAVKTNAEPDVGLSSTKTSTGNDFVPTDIELDFLNFLGSNTISSKNTEYFSGNNNNNNHWGWMFGGGNATRSSQRSLGFSSHSNSVNGHASASSNIDAFRLLYTDKNGNILGEDRAHITEINETGFNLFWNELAPAATSNVKFDSTVYAYHGFSQPPDRKSEYLKTYRNGKPRSFLANGSTVTIETAGNFETTPNISIFGPSGSKILEQTMTANAENYTYQYQLNGAKGWYDVEIEGEKWGREFYQAEVWQDNYTDSGGSQFSFRKKINVTETGTGERWFEPIDKTVEFDFGPSPESVRLVAWNGSRNLEIPVQLRNKTPTSGELQESNVVFLSSLGKQETRDYFVISGSQPESKNYVDITDRKNSSTFELATDRFRSVFDGEKGGLLSTVFSSIGSNTSLVGQAPIDRYPEFSIGINTFTPRKDSSPDFSMIEGPLFDKFSFSGYASGDPSKPYNLSCSIYGKSNHMICEKNQSTTSDESISDFFFNSLFLESGKMQYFEYMDSSFNNFSDSISKDDGNNIENIDNGAKWAAFYNNRTGDGVADIFLDRTFSKTDQPEIQFQDNSENDFYRSKIIDSDSISENDYFYTKTARLVFNGVRSSEAVNETYNELTNPVTVRTGIEETRDKATPYYTSTGNLSSDDVSNATLFSYWKDDSLLDYAEINITGNGRNGSDTELYYNNSFEIKDDGFTNESWVNVTVPADKLNAGLVNANITVFDISGKSNSTEISFNITDTTPPEIDNIKLSPDSKAQLDPLNRINFTANITDFSNVSAVNLTYRSFNSSTNSWNFYNNLQMRRSAGENFTNTYKTNFTPQTEANYSYFINATDTNGLIQTTVEKNISVFNDSTWGLNSNLKDATETFNTNTSLGYVLINNTGDYDISINISSNLNSRTWINGSRPPFVTETMGAGETLNLSVNGTTRKQTETEGVDEFNLTFSNSTLNPEKNVTSAILTTSTGGPFLDPSIDRFDPRVTQGDEDIEVESSVTNRGNETANNTKIELVLPGGWSPSGNNTAVSNITDVAPDSTKTFTTFFDVSTDAQTGNVVLKATGSAANTTNRSVEETVTVEELAESTPSESSGGGSSGGSSGGGGGISLPTSDVETRNLEIETQSELTMIRGRDSSFSFSINNPFNARLEDVAITASGFLSTHIELEPSTIDSIPANSSEQLKVKITAPEYLTLGVHELNFSITGVKNTTEVRKSENFTVRSGSFTRLNAMKQFTIRVHEFSKENATNYLNSSREILERLEENGIASRESRSLVRDAEQSFNDGDYGPTRETYEEMSSRWDSYRQTSSQIEELKTQIESAENRGIEVDRSSRLVKLAEAALERGDITGAATRSTEARNLYQLQTKGAFNPVYFIRNNIYKIVSMLLLGTILSLLVYYRLRLSWIKRKIKSMEVREESVKNNIRKLQEESLSGDKLSIESYEERMIQYEDEIVETVQKRLKLETEKAALVNFGRPRQRLENERGKLIDMVKEAQHNYYNEEKISKRIYETKINSLYERLSEVESSLSEKIVEKETGGVMKWRN